MKLDKWSFNPASDIVPIIIPRNYLNLYNFGFAQSRNLPQLSEGVMGMVNLDIRIMGNGQVKQMKGNIVGFSNRLNTILVPESFMNWANEAYGAGEKAEPSRLIVEVNNPADERIAKFSQQKGMKQKVTVWMPVRNLVLENRYRYCIVCWFANQCAFILYFDIKYISVAAEEFYKTRKFTIDRL